MNSTPLEDQVHDALHRRVDPIQRSPLTVIDVRQRARRVQRRRAAAAGAAVAAVLAIAVPVGFTMVGSAQRSDVPPATHPPAPPAVVGTVRFDPRSAVVVESTAVPLVDVDGPSLITEEGTLSLPKIYDTITPYLDGWVGVAVNEGVLTLEFLTSDLEVEDGPVPTGGLVVSPDGTHVAWSEYDGTRWQVVRAAVEGSEEWSYTRFAPGPQEQTVEPVAFASATSVVLEQNDASGVQTTYLADDGQLTERRGLVRAYGASAATGMISGRPAVSGGKACSVVVDASVGSGFDWQTCDYTLGSFSRDGQYVVGFAAESDAYGSPTVAILDASTGEALVDFEIAGSRNQVVAFHDRVAWEDDGTLVARLMAGDDYFIVRLAADGTVQRVGITSAGLSGLSVAEVR